MQFIKTDPQGKPHLWFKGLLLAILLILFICLFFVFSAVPPLEGFALPEYEYLPASAGQPFFQDQLIPNGKTEAVHCATVVEISGGRLLAFWYGGSDERDQDVCISQGF